MKAIPYENIAKYFSGECSLSELNEIEDWKNESPENIEIFKQYANIFEISQIETDFLPDTEKALEKVSGIINDKKTINLPVNKRRNILSIAASIAVLLVSGILLTMFVGKLSIFNQQVVFQNINWENSQDTLPDGTVVYLNKGSQLVYPNQFSDKCREVILFGEAFFEVVKDKTRPFVVNTNGAEIKVLGTSFNVSAYEHKEEVEVIVASGSVEVKSKPDKKQLNSNKSVIKEIRQVLEAGTMAVVTKTGNEVTKTNNTKIAYLDWRKEKIVFKQTNIKEVLKKLEQIYNVKISVNNKELLNKKLTAKFSKQSIDSVLKVINITFYPDKVVNAFSLEMKKKENEQQIFFGNQKNK